MWKGSILTILVGFFEVHVDNTTGPDLVHFASVQSLDISEYAGADIL